LIIDTTDTQVLIAPVIAILRKALLCNLDDDPGMAIVIDCQRESMPITSIDILVPVFPKGKEMILNLGYQRFWPFKKGRRLAKFGITWRTQKGQANSCMCLIVT